MILVSLFDLLLGFCNTCCAPKDEPKQKAYAKVEPDAEEGRARPGRRGR